VNYQIHYKEKDEFIYDPSVSFFPGGDNNDDSDTNNNSMMKDDSNNLRTQNKNDIS